MGWSRDPLWWEIMKDRPFAWFPMQDYFSGPNNIPIEVFNRYTLTQPSQGFGWNDKTLIRGANKFLTYNGSGWLQGNIGGLFGSHAGSNGKMTLEMLVNPGAVADPDQTLIMKGQASYEYVLALKGTGILWTVTQSNGTGVFEINLGTTAGIVQAGSTYHIVATYDRAALLAQIYVNGTLVGNATSFTSQSSATGSIFQIGHRGDNLGQTISAKTGMGHVCWYDYALSCGRIGGHYQAFRQGSRSPVVQLRRQ